MKATAVDPELKASSLRCGDIITQVASVQEALRGVSRELMRNHLKHCATAAIKQGDAKAQAMYDELLELVYKHLR
jgi:DNA-binding FrmR family transcriptional regulator